MHQLRDQAPYPPLHVMQMPPPSFALPAQLPEAMGTRGIKSGKGSSASRFLQPALLLCWRCSADCAGESRLPTSQQRRSFGPAVPTGTTGLLASRNTVPPAPTGTGGEQKYRASSSHWRRRQHIVHAVSATEPVQNGLSTHLEAGTQAAASPRRRC